MPEPLARMGKNPALNGAKTALIRAGLANYRTKTVAARAHRADELALGYDLSTEPGARAYCRELARRTVMRLQAELLTKEAAIHATARRYRLGSFIRKLWKDEPCACTLDKVVRLERAHDAAMAASEEAGW